MIFSSSRPRPASLIVPPCLLLFSRDTHLCQPPLRTSAQSPLAAGVSTRRGLLLNHPGDARLRPDEATRPRAPSLKSCGLKAMCQLHRQPGRPRSALGQVCGCMGVLWRHAGGFRWVWLKLRRSAKGETGRRTREKGVSSNAVGAGREASNGRFSRTTTITGSYVATPRCCEKGDEECKGGISCQKWSPDEGIRGENMGWAYERGRSLARCGRRRQGRVVHRSSGELSPTLGAKL